MGTFQIFQNAEFVDIFARLNGLHVIDIDGLKVLFSKNRLLGAMKGLVGCPEAIYPNGEWVEKVDGFKCAHIDVQTTEAIVTLDHAKLSPADSVNFYIDLNQDEDQLYQNLKGSCRRKIRNAEKSGLIFREAISDADIREYDRIIRITSRDGELFSIFDLDFVREIVKTPFASVVLVCYANRVVGADLILTDRTATVWSGGYDKDFFHLKPGNFLTWQGILWAKDRGYECYDLGSQSIKDLPGIASYKQSFGTLTRPAYSYRIVQSLLKSRLVEMGDRLY